MKTQKSSCAKALAGQAKFKTCPVKLFSMFNLPYLTWNPYFTGIYPVKSNFYFTGIIFLAIILFGFFGVVKSSQAAVDLPWSTTFDCNDWEYAIDSLNPSCATLSPGSGDVCGGVDTQITDVASMRSGSKGMRQWIGNGINNGSRGLYVDFAPQEQLWVRWYQRYQENFTWGGIYAPYPFYDKMIYVNVRLQTGYVIPEPSERTFHLGIYNGSDFSILSSPEGYGWDNISEGGWHCYDVYMDRNGTYRMWLDGKLIIESTDAVKFSAKYQVVQFGSNQRYPDNNGCFYEDFDELVIYNTTPPNTDAQGNPFIGPIGWAGSDTTPPSHPTGLSVS